MTDQDWADEEAARLIPNHLTVFEIDDFRVFLAAAIRAAHKRGMGEGLREALGICDENTQPRTEIRSRIFDLKSQTP